MSEVMCDKYRVKGKIYKREVGSAMMDGFGGGGTNKHTAGEA